ncbi:MAG TPA: glycosyltransferase 87 family protein [Candidatus Sulfotelmatobacter sp.]|nr:glycosyltransferase 87 family protein [Candidatus Sulfotelmatobacter sp.]
MRFPPKRTLTLAVLLAVGTSYYYFALLIPRAHWQSAVNQMAGGYAYGGDFYPIWLTGRALLAHRSDPYTRETTRQIQIGLFGRPMDPHRPSDPPAEFRAFAYPLYTDLLAAPLLPLSFNGVRIALTIVLPVLTATSLVAWLRAFRLQVAPTTLAVVIILTLVSYPVLEGLYAQQAGLLAGAALALAVYAMARGRLFLAGMLLAAASVKPQMVWLLALWLLLWALSDWKRRKRFAISFLLSMALLCLVSQFVLPGWFSGWWRSLVGYSRYTLPPLTQLVLGRFLGILLGVAMLALAVAICWRTRHRLAASAAFSLAVSFVLAVTVILMPTGGAVYDQVVLLPAIFWLGSRRGEILSASRPIRVLALAALVTISWQWFMACAVALGSLVSPLWARSPAVVVFPARMAAPLPFVLLALLSFFAGRMLRGQTHALAESHSSTPA